MFTTKYKDTYLDTYAGFKHYLAYKRTVLFTEARHGHLRNTGIKNCEGCGVYLKYSKRTIDHIIPMSFIREKELYGLWLDPRNFQVLCQKCNMEKDSDLEFLPELVKQRLGL